MRRTNVEPNIYPYVDLVCYALNVVEGASYPENFKEVFERKESKEWLKVVNEKMHSLVKNQTWTLTRLPKNQWGIEYKWILKKKESKLQSKICGKWFQSSLGDRLQ